MGIRNLLKSIPGAARLATFVQRYRRPTPQKAILRRLRKSATGPFRRDPQSRLVVSVTSFPARIHLVWRAIESIFQQDTKPARVVLVLSTEEFPDKVLPESVMAQCRRGLEVLWTARNLRAYTKLLPAKQAFPDEMIVTIDDDVVYEPWMLTKLVEASQAAPNVVIGHRGRVITGARNCMETYLNWPLADQSSPRSRVMLTGVGGVLYPPHAMATETLLDYSTAKEICPLADDIWFWACTRLAGAPPLCLGNHHSRVIFDDTSETPRLSSLNVLGGMNDMQFKAVCDHFQLWAALESSVP
jgi:hypothetical protein